MLSFGIEKWLVGIAILLATLVGGEVHGYWRGYKAGYAASEKEWAKLKSEMEDASRRREQALRDKGDALAAELEAAKNKVRVETIEVVRIVKQKASATRACFTPDVTEILNRNTPIRETVERPGAPKQIIDHRSEAPVEGGTSEAAAAQWVAEARAAHDQCRAQLGTLGDWIRAAAGKKS